MKRGGPEHPKTRKLARRLELTRYEAVGLLECLFHWAGAYARRGDIGRHDPSEIADGIGWQGDPKALMTALVETGWLDRCACHGYRIHGWPEHADQAVRKTREVSSYGFLECYSAAGDPPEALRTQGGGPQPPADSRQTAQDPRRKEQDPRLTAGEPAEEELQAARLECWAELEAAMAVTKMPGDQLMAWASRTSDGKAFERPESIRKLGWLKTTASRLRTKRLGVEADAAMSAHPPPRSNSIGNRAVGAFEQFAAEKGIDVRAANITSGPGRARDVLRGGPDSNRPRLPAGSGPSDAANVRAEDGGPSDAQ